MKPSIHDLVGTLVVASTLAMLVLHNGPFGHRLAHDEALRQSRISRVGEPGEPVIAFVGFNVLTGHLRPVRSDQVVVVRGSVVADHGSLDEVELPDDAHIVRGDRSDFLVPGVSLLKGSLVFTPLRTGHRADILLLDDDPRLYPDVLEEPEGVMVQGRWYGSQASAPRPATGGVELTALR